MRMLIAAAFVMAGTAAQAASLRVAPVLIDLTAPAAAATLTVRNESAQPVNVQTRVFRWSQNKGEERLEPTTDVAVSPPMLTLKPGVDNVVRVVRVTKRPVSGEESYRVVVDELPDARQRRPGTIKLLVRHSIPVFFADSRVEPARVSWSAAQSGGRLTLVATNSGGGRQRISGLKVAAPGGAALVSNPGLVGYVLGGSVMQWSFPARGGGGGPLDLTAQSESGLINAKALPARR